MDKIPEDLIINFDQTGIKYVPVTSWTMEQEGSKCVEVVAKDDKQQITAVFAASFTEEFLPPQLVYQCKTERCLPQFQFPPDWNITFLPNHQSNELIMKEYFYFEEIILPYNNKKQEDLKLVKNHPALLIFNNNYFKVQCTKDLLTFLDDKNIHVVFIPANCTDKLQPLDLGVNKASKNFLKIGSYAQEICSQLQGEAERKAVDLRLSVVKPLGGRWMISLYDYLKAKPDIVHSGFKEAGIVNCLNTEEQIYQYHNYN